MIVGVGVGVVGGGGGGGGVGEEEDEDAEEVRVHPSGLAASAVVLSETTRTRIARILAIVMLISRPAAHLSLGRLGLGPRGDCRVDVACECGEGERGCCVKGRVEVRLDAA